MNFKRFLSVLLMIFLLAGLAVYRLPIDTAAAQGPYVDVQPNHGPVGTPVVVSGISFVPSVAGNTTANATLTFAKTYFPDKDTLIKSTLIDWYGNFETNFIIGQHPAGRQKVWVLDDSASPPRWVSTIFTVEPQTKLSATTGYAGDNITISGKGFAALSSITIYFDNRTLDTLITTASGNFSKSAVTIPPSSQGVHMIKVLDGDSNNTTSEFTTLQQISISPPSGQISELVTFNGTSFADKKLIRVSINGNLMDTIPSLIISSPTGNFKGHFYMPAYSLGIYNIIISDGINEASASFQVTFGGWLNRIVGYVGSNVTYTGSGFMPGRVAALHFDGSPVAEATVTPNGNLVAEFTIPVSTGGAHTVLVTDGTSNTTHTFTVFSVASSSINRDMGYVGNQVIFSGVHFVPGKILVIYYDADPIAEAIVEANGNFSASFIIPPGAGGEHNISTTDGISTANKTFTLETIPPEAPTLLIPVADAELKEHTAFIWERVSDPSGVIYTFQLATSADFGSSNITSLLISKSGLEIPEFKLAPEANLPTDKRGTAYYWRVRATDMAMNTGVWSEISTFKIPAMEIPWFMYSIIVEGGVFALLFGFWMIRRKG